MIESLEIAKRRRAASNSDRQKTRMQLDKKRAFRKALMYSYQSGWIKRDGDDAQWVRALINPDRVKFDYDEKILSVDWEDDFHCGDTFEWPKDSGAHWIILKQEITELAYFRANIRRCHLLTAVDPETNEVFSQWCAIRGPVETKINTIQKAGVAADVPNLTLDIYMIDNEQNRRTFDRYENFQFNGRWWKVQATDSVSTPNILEVVAEEDYECHHKELIVIPTDPNPPVPRNANQIQGESFIKPLEKQHYIPTTVVDEWKWEVSLDSNNKEVRDVLSYKTNDDGSIDVIWTATFSGQFLLQYGQLQKIVVVESLF